MKTMHVSTRLIAGGLLAAFTALVAHSQDSGSLLSGGGQGQLYSQGPEAGGGLMVSGRALGAYGLQAGPFKIRPHVSLALTHEDNVYLEEGDEEDSWYLTFTPGAMALIGDERRNYAYLDYEAGLSTFSSIEDEDIDSHSVTLLGHWEGGKSSATAWHRYREVRDVDTILGTRLTKKENVTSGEVTRRMTAKTSVGLRGQHQDHDYDSDDFSDYVQDEAAGRLYWHASPKTDLFTELAYGWIDVDADPNDYGDAEYTEVSLGIRGQVRPKVSATGQVGWQTRDFEDEAIDDIEHWVASLRMNAALVERINAMLGLWTRITPAVQEPGLSIVETRIEPGISRRLFTDRVVGSLSLVFGWVDYMGTMAPVELEPSEDRVVRAYDGRDDEYWGFTLGVDWWFARYWSAGIGYSYIENDSSLDDYQLDRADIDPASYDAGRWLFRLGFNY